VRLDFKLVMVGEYLCIHWAACFVALSAKLRYEKCLGIWGNANLRRRRQKQPCSSESRRSKHSSFAVHHDVEKNVFMMATIMIQMLY
jgi:hypothetical protein